MYLNKLLIADRKYVELKFFKNFGTKPNLEQPMRYNEHISKILLTQPTELIVKCVDKYDVRNYVNTKIGGNVLNELYGLFNNFKELESNWIRFPSKFVIKATHGCGWNFICKNKDRANTKELKILLNHWLRSNFYYSQRELVYKNLKPRLLVERYLEDDTGGLKDYKVHCFNGEPKFINVIVDRFSNMKLNTYDINWNFINVSFDNHYPNDQNWQISKPSKLEDILNYSRILSKDFNYVRVDFYIVEDKVYFGELTFTPGNGAYTSFTEKDDYYFGNFFNNDF